MSRIGQPERSTQDRVIALFRDELGYRVLGDRSSRAGNSNAYVPDLPGCVAVGGTRAEVTKLIHEAIEFHVDEMKSNVRRTVLKELSDRHALETDAMHRHHLVPHDIYPCGWSLDVSPK